MTVYKLFSMYFYNEKGFNWVFYERVLTGFSMKIKIKKNTERIKNIIELKCNIELEIRFKT